MHFIILSNIFLLFPVIASFLKGEWIYFAFAFGLLITSPCYHSCRIYWPTSRWHTFWRGTDWLIAVGAYIYMFHFVFSRVPQNLEGWFAASLILSVLFFWYGFKFGTYDKFHPWFHVIAPLISGFIVLSAK